MWSQQIIVAILCALLALQQAAAVVNSGQTSKAEESKNGSSEPAETTKSNPSKEPDSASVPSEDNANRREAPADTYGSPLSTPSDTYLPSGTSNINLPVPVYGVPDAPTNNIVYPAPPPDIPPPVALPSPSYDLPLISTNFGAPIIASVSTAYLPPQSNGFSSNSIQFDTSVLSPPKFLGPSRGPKPNYGPPPSLRPQYGPPRKPYFSKYPSKFPIKLGYGVHKHVKPLSTYGPPSGYFKDNYSPSKINFNVKNHNNLLSNVNSFTHNSFSGFSNFGGNNILTQYGVPNVAYGVPNVGIETHSTNLNLLNINDHGVSTQYGAPAVSVQVIPTDLGHGSHSVSTQYVPPSGDVLGPPKPQYGPPQPSPHPKPPHPGAPAPPTPPDIKYDGWQPIPGLVSRAPTSSYGPPPTGSGHGGTDLLPPALESHDHHQQSSSGYGSMALGASYSDNKPAVVSDSYGAPLNTVTGSGGIVSSSGDEVHGQHLSHSGAVDIDIGHNVDAVKSIGIEIYPSGSGSIEHSQSGGHIQSGGHVQSGGHIQSGGHVQSGGYAQSGGHIHSGRHIQIGGHNVHFPDSYSSPPLNSYSIGGPYAAAHSYNNIAGGFGSFNTFNSHNSFKFHKSNGYKGIGSLSSSGRGLIPPSGLYGVPPSGQYGTPLFTNTQHGPPLNALKINPPRHPVIHRDPVPQGVFDSLTKGDHKHHGQISSSHSFGSTYLPPPVSDIPKPTRGRLPPAPSSLYSLPQSHSSVSFQNFAHGSSTAGLVHQNLNLNIDGGHASLTSYNVPLNIVDGSYDFPQVGGHTSANLGSEVVGLDLSHPAVTIDLTQANGGKGSYSAGADCALHKTQALPSLSYGVPSANSYTASLSSLTTNIGGGQHHLSSGPTVDISYEVTDPQSHGHDSYDLHAAHSQKVASTTKLNSIETEQSEGKSYGKTVAESFGPHSELLQSQSLDLNNFNLQGNLGSYTLQIQSADGGQSQIPHDQVLNEELLQSILAAIEQPQQNGESLGQPIIQLQKSLEKHNFVTNETISSVVEKVTDAEIEHSSSLQYVVEPSNEVHTNVTEKLEEPEDETHESNIGVALYFNNKRSKKETDQTSSEKRKSSETVTDNSR